jgi:hypothetical protein
MRRLLALLLLVACGRAQAAVLPDVEPAVQTSERASRDAAVVIGNEGYRELPQATYAGLDAPAFQDWLLRSAGLRTRSLLSVQNASADQLRAEIKKAARKVSSGGTLWIYFSGHGTLTDDGRRALVGIDAKADDIAAGSLPLAEVAALVARERRVGRAILVADAGFGPLTRDGVVLVPGRSVALAEDLASLDGKLVPWLADGGTETAASFPPGKHGQFTWLVLGALRGWADGELTGVRDAKVSLGEAQAYVTWRVRNLGRDNSPTRDARADAQALVLISGRHFEQSPPDDLFSVVSLEERQRRFNEAETRLRAEANAFWQDTLRIAGQGGPAAKKALEAFIKEYEGAAVTVEWGLALPEVKAARQVLANIDSKGIQAVAEAAVEPCDDLVAMEGAASLGQLSQGQRNCLEKRISAERLQTRKDKVSRVLIANAEVAGDQKEWERLMQRHLEVVDRSDPNLCFRYALYLHKDEASRQPEAIRWADYALSNRQVWVGEEHVKRVSGLYRLRAESASRLWEDAEQSYLSDRSPEAEAASAKYRGWTMNYAREWLDYARAAKINIDAPYKLCMSASGTEDFCREGAVPLQNDAPVEDEAVAPAPE